MRQRLAFKFLMAYLVFALGSFALLALGGDRFFINASRTKAAQELYKEALVIARKESERYASDRRLDTLLMDQYAEISDTRILVLNDAFLVVYDSSPGHPMQGRQIAGFDPAESRDNTRIGGFYGTFSDSMVSAFAPISAGIALYGYLTLHESASIADARANAVLTRAYLVFGAILSISLLVLVVLRRTVLKPLKLITEGAGEFAAGNLEHRIQVRSHDEMGYLSNTLNVMAEQLKATDDNQRKFIANVSHDFRSPLTSIRGYLQAMADGVIPPENQGKYMNIIIGETDRLTNLTQSMLSLNSLDEARHSLELSDFDLTELIRSACETFEGVCSRRGISFDLVFPAQEVPVHADYGRIGQAMHNLIDNAIKFSPDNSSIRIRVTELGDKACVAVKDYGIGIEKDDLSRIFTRFYKTDSSRGKDKKGTGLGLSIAKQILEQQNGQIEISSVYGEGTVVTITLPKAE